MAAVVNQDIITATIRVKDQSRLGFNSYAREAARASKASQAFKDHAIDNIVKGLDKQLIALKLSSKQMDFHAAASAGATKEQLKAIHATHQQVDALRASQAQELAATEAKEQAKREQDRLNSSIEKTIARLNQEAKEFNMTEQQVEEYRLELMGASKAQIAAVGSARSARNATMGIGDAGKKSVKGLRLMRGGLGQVGHQVQDIAVQLQMGQNAMLVFGQQGSQIASLFGSRGAIIGAVLAVGAAVGTSLAPALFKSTSAFEDVKKAAEETGKYLKIDFLNSTSLLTNKLNELQEKSAELATATLRIELISALKLSKDAAEEFSGAIESLLPRDNSNEIAYTTTLERMRTALNISNDDAEILRAKFIELTRGVKGSEKGIADFVESLASGKDVTDENNEALFKLALKLQQLVSASGDARLLQDSLRSAMEGASTATVDSDKKTKDLVQTKNDLVRRYWEELNAIGKTNVELAVRQAILAGMNPEEVANIRNIAERIRITNAYNDAIKEENKLEEDRKNKYAQKIKSNEDFVDSLGRQAAAMGKSNTEILQATINSRNLAPELRAAAQAALDFMAAFEKKQDAQAIKDGQQSQLDALVEGLRTQEEAQIESYAKTKGLIDTARLNDLDTTMDWNEIERRALEEHLEAMNAIREKAAQKEGQKISFLERATIEGEKRKKQFAMMSATEQSQHVLGELGNQFNGIAKNNKKLFAISKAFNIANAIMNTSTAATVAYKSYPPPLNYVMAGGVIAAGMGQVAQIKAQSFEGGGFTGSGSRSGGMDGKGGFAAMLHPNESVIDHTKGQSGGITIVNNIDATGSGADVDMKIRAAMQQTSQQTIMSIQDLMRRRRFG